MSICNLPHHFLLAAMLLHAAAEAGDYRAGILKWRENYEAVLKKDNGWLAVSGLYWLKDGDNTFGSGPGNTIVLPAGASPEMAGAFIFHNGQTRLRVKPGVDVRLNGESVKREMPIKPDPASGPDVITLGRLRMIVIERGGRYGVRLWDSASRARAEFTGIRWFRVEPSYRIESRFTSYPQPKKIPILNVLGHTDQLPSPGYAAFTLNGKKCHLEPVIEEGQLFFIFKDMTSGKETYPAGRFLYADLPKDGKVILDFNKAYNPPCAFTSYATCPLPPKQNHLPAAVRAGALTYHSPVATE